MIVQNEDSEETEEEQPMFKRKRTKKADPEKAQPASENMDTEADTGMLNTSNNYVPILQAQTYPILSPLKQSNPESNDDIDPTLLQPLYTIHPPSMSDCPL
ncbi:hypothetical protein A2U01_0052350 [Trifolium medium]|uniref:Uncharacterized protein n=1 Tax=Trifolium medium TaxID=97028 RepID=A0A392R4I6_9FABA|nr:hypothetical protein [Trifolium medium]